jgi:hypothetical protein
VKHSRAVEKPFFPRVAFEFRARSGIDGNRAGAHAGTELRKCVFVMGTAVLTITLLTVAASLASWLFSQWLAGRARVSGAALAVGGSGTVLLIGSVALVMIAVSTWWQRLIPVQDFSPLFAPAPALTPTSARSAPTAEVAPRPDPAADLADAFERQRMSARKPEMLAAAERHLEASEHAQAIGLAREYLDVHPTDPEMASMLARSVFAAEHPGSAAIIPAVAVAQWPATDCVASTRSDESARWMLDNGCGRVVAVLFASCQLSETACFANALVSQGWSYEPAGILMTAANEKPVPLRLGKGGPLVAPIFTIRDSAGARRQIRYLACEVTSPAVLQVLSTSSSDEERLAAELRADACYSQVLDWTRSGQRHGSSPDALLRRGID